MAQYNRPPKKKAKGPDEFVSFFDHLVRYFMVHRTKLFVVIGVAVLAFVGYGVYLYIQNQRVHEFASLYSEALTAPSEEALAAWQKLYDKNPPLDLKESVAMQMGQIYAEQGEWLQAAEQYRLVSEAKSETLRYPAQWSLAVALENAGKLSEAQAIYQGMSEDTQNPYRDQGRLGVARVLILSGKVDQGRQILTNLVKPGAEVHPAVRSAARDQLLALEIPPDVATVAPETQGERSGE